MVPVKLKVKIEGKKPSEPGWFENGEIHEVNNYITISFSFNEPCFEKEKGMYGIPVRLCRVLSDNPKVKESEFDSMTKSLLYKEYGNANKDYSKLINDGTRSISDINLNLGSESPYLMQGNLPILLSENFKYRLLKNISGVYFNYIQELKKEIEKREK
jgi:hypothetical protein